MFLQKLLLKINERFTFRSVDPLCNLTYQRQYYHYWKYLARAVQEIGTSLSKYLVNVPGVDYVSACI